MIASQKTIADGAVPMVEIWRGPILEGVHHGHAVIADHKGRIIESWGREDVVILPRSSVKMIQALPLMLQAGGDRLSDQHLALACASHQGAAQHRSLAGSWLRDLGLDESDLRCGIQPAQDKAERERLREAGLSADQLHNNCSGKHAGFLMLNQQLSGDAEYVDPDHPVQLKVRDMFEEVTGRSSPGFGIDGCSAPNFACRLDDLAKAMARFAHPLENPLGKAQAKLRDAMMAHPDLVAGKGRPCTELMQAMQGKAAIKFGAEAVYTAILPAEGLGIAVKILDGAARGCECVIAALLARLGVLDPDHPAVCKRMNSVERNWRGIETGSIRPVASLLN